MSIYVKVSIGSVAAFLFMATAFFNVPFSSRAATFPAVISIEDGSGFKEIGALLNENGIIHSPAFFNMYTILSGSAHRLKPGMYSFENKNSLASVVRKLVAGPEDFIVLIVEGKTLAETDDVLASLNLIVSGELIAFSPEELVNTYPFLRGRKSLEGFIFPDTYRIAPGSSLATIANIFLKNFNAKAIPVLKEAKRESAADIYESLILASLIEKEVPHSLDRSLVSGILEKRLEIGMAIQIDATVLYAKCKGRFEGCDPLTRSDFKVSSVFNTYLRRGLPPTPISNPGLDAIRAAVYPQNSGFLYYLSDPETKQTIFSETLDEHNVQRSRYLHL